MTTDGRSPTSFSHITKDQLKTIIDTFGHITWPASAQTVDQLLTALGWERVRLRLARTDLPVNRAIAGVDLTDSDAGADTLFRGADFNVTDSGNSLDVRDLWSSFRMITEWVTDMVGEPAATEGGDIPENPTVWWDLPSGGGVKLTMFAIGLRMYLLSQRAADNERFDREHPEYTYE